MTKLAAELEGSTSAIVGTFAKLTVAQDYDLRKVVREAGGKYHVLKNKLAARAAKGTQVEAALQGLKGVSSVAYTSGDPVALAKAISTWVKDNAEFTFKLGIVDGKVISIEEIKQLATMPGKEELFSKLLFLINAPAQRLATVIASHRTRSGRGGQPGGRAEQVCRRSSSGGGSQGRRLQRRKQQRPKQRQPPAAEHQPLQAEPSAIAEGAAPDVTGAPQADPAQPETGEASQAQSASTEAPAEG